MFAFGLKGRTAEVIRRGGHAVFLGDFIDVDGINTSELNDEAKAALYFYAVANCLYDLYIQMKLSRCGDAPWADFGFFMEKACDGIERYEKSRGIVRGGMASQTLPLLGQIGGYAMTNGAYPDVMSAREVVKLDPASNLEDVHKLIVAWRNNFHDATKHMFSRQGSHQ